MSHHKLRGEKVCLNCGEHPLYDRYCHHCGQENVEPRQTLWQLIVHFFNDVTHFDGKFFSTLKLLLFKPGFLSEEYVQGRRAKYLDPIRMYLFISALFLFVFLYAVGKPSYISTKKDQEKIAAIDAARIEDYANSFNFTFRSTDGEQVTILNMREALRHGTAYYDSVQHSLPRARRDNALQRYISLKGIKVYEVYDGDPYNFFPRVVEKFLHSVSKIFFISLPIFAGLLSLLYIRRRKQFYYAAHAIFSLHYYCVLFIFLILLAVVLMLVKSDTVLFLFVAGLLLYLLIAMKKFYRQNWLKTALKFSVLSVTMSFLLLMLVFMLWIDSVISMGS